MYIFFLLGEGGVRGAGRWGGSFFELKIPGGGGLQEAVKAVIGI